MNVFVGTLYCGENEYQECAESIASQTYKPFQHFVFKDLPNKQAHVTLYKSFLENPEFDLLIKVDADMVLVSEHLFDSIVRRFNQNRQMDLLGIAVYDFFSGQLIWGLNSYRKSVRWDFDKETVFVDIPDISPDKVVYDNQELAPAAIHCKNPSPFQAFHYGVHRGIKSLQAKGGSHHWTMMQQTWDNFLQKKDSRIGLAVLGAELAYAGKFTISSVDYTNPYMADVLDAYKGYDTHHLIREIIRIRLLNWGFFPSSLRRKILIALQRHGIRNPV